MNDNFSNINKAEISLAIKNLFADQLIHWELARINYDGLQSVKTKAFSFGDFEIRVQFNPARMVSSGAKMDAKTLSERKCFLCQENRPAEQKGVRVGDYSILVNPFPIFPSHFTIVHATHIEQQIFCSFTDMLSLSELMDDCVVFYNGPKCGASAPDHLHFQAGTKNFLPLLQDYARLKSSHAEVMVETEAFQLVNFKNYLRTVYCIESISKEAARDSFEKLYAYFQRQQLPDDAPTELEPMMNIVCTFENGKWYVFVLPRANFRPWQYAASADEQLLVSPATVEMCGVFITPIESHFERITKEDIRSIMEQSTAMY
jgi:ATP adenylyltransferase/5',5'''-P-1,P-4-tetraphosphate phosphorylase II